MVTILLDITAPVRHSQYMKSHYAVTSTIRYYKPPCKVALLPGSHPRLRVTGWTNGSGAPPFDVSRWKDEPHVALANLRDEPEAVLRFTHTYGILARDKRQTVPVREVLQYRDFLRSAWEGDTYNFFAQAVNHPFLCVQPTGLQIAVNDSWMLIQVLFARDIAEKRIKKCGNPDCPAPYFCAVRKGQKFCSQKCAVLINVRHFREREAALKAKGGRYAKAKKA